MKPLSIALVLASSLSALGLAGCQTVEGDGYSYSTATYGGYYGRSYDDEDVVVRRPGPRYGYGYGSGWGSEPRRDRGPQHVDRGQPRPSYDRPPEPRRDGPRFDRPPEPRRDGPRYDRAPSNPGPAAGSHGERGGGMSGGGMKPNPGVFLPTDR